MAISLARANAHIAHWTPLLPSRPWWPNHLFFAAHATTAAKILDAGSLRSRNALLQLGPIDHDIANQEALGTNPAAFDFVRLYFRPRTHFHLRTEGIKLLSDRYRLPAHMSVPIMFLFNLTAVVTRPSVAFCERKMAHAGIQPGADEQYFDGIDFKKVYHDSPIADPVARADINDRRMAEVLIPDELPLDATLDMIICRSTFDAFTLRHFLGDPDRWRPKVRVSTKPPEMFFCWGAYISELQLAGNALTLKVKTSTDYRLGQPIKIKIVQHLPNGSLEFSQTAQLTNNPFLISGWNTLHTDNWTIEIEDALAFRGQIPVAAPAKVFTSA